MLQQTSCPERRSDYTKQIRFCSIVGLNLCQRFKCRWQLQGRQVSNVSMLSQVLGSNAGPQHLPGQGPSRQNSRAGSMAGRPPMHRRDSVRSNATFRSHATARTRFAPGNLRSMQSGFKARVSQIPAPRVLPGRHSRHTSLTLWLAFYSCLMGQALLQNSSLEKLLCCLDCAARAECTLDSLA